MSNILDYISWRGDLTFKNDRFNEIDNLVLSRVAYFYFEGILKENETISLNEAYNRFQMLDQTKVRILQKEDLDLFPAVANSRRYGNLFVKDFVNNRDLSEEKQFSAITFILPDHTAYVAFRGTDNTLIGWKEDFNMSFMKSIPAQKAAKDYLNKVDVDRTYMLRVGGHSKGGNLAVYAAAFCNDDIKDRIIDVYNNDGPGFFDEIINSENYQSIVPKINTYIPQSSIIGRLLNHAEKCNIVKSTQVGIYQHDLYSWQLMGNGFTKVEEVTKESEFIDKTLKNMLKEVDEEQREKFWMTMFEILSSTKAETLAQIRENWFSNSKIIYETYKNLDDESKKIINTTLKSLLSIAKDNIKSGKSSNKRMLE